MVWLKQAIHQKVWDWTLVSLWCGGTSGRRTVTWLPNFLGWVDLLTHGAPQGALRAPELRYNSFNNIEQYRKYIGNRYFNNMGLNWSSLINQQCKLCGWDTIVEDVFLNSVRKAREAYLILRGIFPHTVICGSGA